MMHQAITCPEYVANVINNIADKDIYQIIPFVKNNNSLFLILYEDCCSTSSIAYGDRGEPKQEEVI